MESHRKSYYARSPFVTLHSEGERERIAPMVLERGRHSLNHGFVIKGGVWIQENVRRFSGIAASLSMDEI